LVGYLAGFSLGRWRALLLALAPPVLAYAFDPDVAVDLAVWYWLVESSVIGALPLALGVGVRKLVDQRLPD
jgi:hypothetical protein